MAELQQGLIPREFEDEANLTPQARRIYNSASSVAGLWSSPRASDGEKGGPNMRGSKYDQMLPSQAVSMVEGNWPTPNALASNDGESPETWRARQERMKLKGYNGNGAGVPLAILVQEACLSSHPALDHFAGSPSPTTGPTCFPPSLPTGGSPKAAPTTPTTSRGGSLVRLNPSFVVWLMAGIEATDWGHSCRTTATALGRTA